MKAKAPVAADWLRSRQGGCHWEGNEWSHATIFTSLEKGNAINGCLFSSLAPGAMGGFQWSTSPTHNLIMASQFSLRFPQICPLPATFGIFHGELVPTELPCNNNMAPTLPPDSLLIPSLQTQGWLGSVRYMANYIRENGRLHLIMTRSYDCLLAKHTKLPQSHTPRGRPTT